MKSKFSSDFTLGVLGGGQLGKMLLAETQKYDVYTKILDPSTEAPCAPHCHEFIQGDLKDFDTVYQFGKSVSVLTIEIEHVNLEALFQLEKEGVPVYPQPSVLEKIKDKGEQKDFYTQHKIPTAPYQRFDTLNALKSAMPELPFVWKSARDGYDGMGVKVVRTVADLEGLNDVPCIAEALVPFETELAVIVARNKSGEVKTYPVVEMEFHPEANQVEYVLCPARIEKSLSEKAQSLAVKVANAFEHIGLLAVEMFLTTSGDLLVNEVAPRTHNSGHYSIEGAVTNQFEQHLRTVLNLPLGDTRSKEPAVMVNLVGAEGYQGPVYYENMEEVLKMPGVTPHLYGKKETRPFRKMGHITVVNPTIEEARAIAATLKKTIQVISK